MTSNRPLFFVGLHQVSDAKHFPRCMLSVNRLEHRKHAFTVHDWLLDSGAFTRIASGRGHLPVSDYACLIRRWSECGNLLAAVSQDYMCEQFILTRTGLTVPDHQRLTIERYDALMRLGLATYVMPVLQGYAPGEYLSHLEQYRSRLRPGMWVGVGSVCKRNARQGDVETVLEAIASQRPDLRLHGFGLKRTALKSAVVNRLLYSCDSMAWSFAARREGRDANDWREAARYCQQVAAMPVQGMLWRMYRDDHPGE